MRGLGGLQRSEEEGEDLVSIQVLRWPQTKLLFLPKLTLFLAWGFFFFFFSMQDLERLHLQWWGGFVFFNRMFLPVIFPQFHLISQHSWSSLSHVQYDCTKMIGNDHHTHYMFAQLLLLTCLWSISHFCMVHLCAYCT